MELLDVSLIAVSERLDSENGQDHRECVWIAFSVHLYICWRAVFDRCQFTCLIGNIGVTRIDTILLGVKQ